MKIGFERVQELAKEALKIYDELDALKTVEEYNAASERNDEAENILYEMLGAALIFDSPSVWPIIELYKASEVVAEYTAGDELFLIQRAFEMLQEYAKETVKNMESK